MKVALTIAGSDPGGGAGMQADLKTFAALRAYGTSVVTAVTVQNTRGVRAVVPVEASVVGAQIAAVLEDFPVAAVKTGMLATRAIVDTVVEALAASRAPLVVDPILVSTSGARLLDEDGARALVERLLPRAAVVTPNIPEAAAITGRAVEDAASIREAARAIRDLGPRVVVVKGGHAGGAESVDVVFDGAFHEIRGARLETRSTHGTGCALSAAIAAGLAQELAPLDAIVRARRFLEGALASAEPLGGGRGPMHHLHPYYPWKDLR